MKRLCAVLLLVFCVGCGGSPTQPSRSSQEPTGADYLNAVLTTMESYSVNRFKIDWPSFKAQALASAPNADSIEATYPAIQTALGLLGDRHSSFVRLDGSYISNPAFPAGCTVSTAPVPAMPSEIGYVRISAFSGSQAAAAEFTRQVQQRIGDQDSENIVGWIVDLRGNGGGNMWPMLAGVGPVLGEGVAGSFVYPTGIPTSWGYGRNGSYAGSTVQQSITEPYILRIPNPRVAVLTDKAVASSGEAIAVAFRARPGARSFGTETCGVPTANRSFPQHGGGTLVLTIALDADRSDRTYDGPIAPDEIIPDSALVVPRAIDWLKGR